MNPIDLSTYSGDAPRCPTCFRPKATPEDTGGPRDSARCWRTLAHKGAADCDANRLDLARFSGDALMGCVLLSHPSDEWDYAWDAGLVDFDHPWDESKRQEGEVPICTPTGDRVLAALRATFDEHAAHGRRYFTGAGCLCDLCKQGGPALALHDRERDQ